MQGTYPLHEHAAEGDVEGVRKLLAGGTTEVDARDDAGCTPLHFASDRGCCEVRCCARQGNTAAIVAQHSSVRDVMCQERGLTRCLGSRKRIS